MSNERGTLYEYWLLAVFALIAIAIVVPSCARRRVAARERAALADVRSVAQALMSYRNANGGFYDSRLACLAAPEDCLPQSSQKAQGFLAPDLAHSNRRHDYSFELMPGPRPEAIPTDSSPTSVTSFCYAAVPQGSILLKADYFRSFAVDHSGVICAQRGKAPRLCDRGRLAQGCTPLKQ